MKARGLSVAVVAGALSLAACADGTGASKATAPSQRDRAACAQYKTTLDLIEIGMKRRAEGEPFRSEAELASARKELEIANSADDPKLRTYIVGSARAFLTGNTYEESSEYTHDRCARLGIHISG